MVFPGVLRGLHYQVDQVNHMTQYGHVSKFGTPFFDFPFSVPLNQAEKGSIKKDTPIWQGTAVADERVFDLALPFKMARS